MEISEIHDQFYSLLHHYIVASIKDKDDAADVLQEVFIKIATKLDSLSGNSKLRSWIFSITRNTIIDYHRKNSSNNKSGITEKIAEATIAEADGDMTKGLDKCLNGFIQELPDEYREIIIDSEIKGIKQKDLVGKYNLAYPSVRSRVQRGRAKLKEMLLSCCRIKADSRGNIMERSSKNGCGSACGEGCA